MRNKLQLLIIEDEPAILTGLIDLFVYHGYEVETAQDGRVGLDKALAGAYDLIILVAAGDLDSVDEIAAILAKSTDPRP